MATATQEVTKEMAKLLLQLIGETSISMRRMAVTDHFDPVREIGKGSYGKVLLASHRTSGQMVALKMLKKDRTGRDIFLLEYTISLCLASHPHIISTYGMVFETLSNYVFVQEIAPAGTLLSIIKPKVGLQEDLAKHCVLQVASALDFMHSKGLVHRDIKLDNILLMDGGCRYIKLADFGLTRLQGTHVPAMSWTIPYMAPELCVLEENAQLLLHPSLDVWAFGVLVYITLTGCFPWNEAKTTDKMYLDFTYWESIKDITQAPSEWKRFTPEARSIFLQMLALNPTDRCPAIEISNYINFPWKSAIPPVNIVYGAGGHQDIHIAASYNWSPCLLLDQENISLTIKEHLKCALLGHGNRDGISGNDERICGIHDLQVTFLKMAAFAVTPFGEMISPEAPPFLQMCVGGYVKNKKRKMNKKMKELLEKKRSCGTWKRLMEKHKPIKSS
ncbi:serine/threonine-protein kinase SBK1-like [Spea bombifrons]|uniref:serine/threonine-protein kinase SBK1-like n=1 Tax=Spea bombifrons TaxID=233779 RepID=UPI00234A0AA5|nr:serine/threonine-protein kinase SBK1-like [Spea bombifrons]